MLKPHFRHLLGIMLMVSSWTAYVRADETMSELPKPNYVQKTEDPEWLAYAAQFHGHLGPWATAGARLGMAGRRAVHAAGYFDVDVTVEGPFDKPPRSCFLDGVQVGTGATLGKRNLHCVKAEVIVLRIKNTRTGQQVEVRPAPALLEIVQSLKPRSMAAPGGEEDDHDHRAGARATATDEVAEALARRVAKMPEQELAVVKPLGKP